MSYVANTRYQIMTPSGWQYFSGIKKSTREDLIQIETASGKSIKVTPEHKLIKENGSVVYAKDLIADDDIAGDIVRKITNLREIYDVFDPINVEGGHLYYANGLISKNCAFIRDFDEIWTSLYPTLSTGGSAILLSTPNGVGGQYYKLWTEAESGANDFNAIRLPWDVHPEHNEEWFTKETRNLSKRQIAQEFLCDFISSGDTFLQPTEFDKLRSMISPPLQKEGPQHGVWVWKKPEPERKYVISSDVARGDSGDYSTFHVIDYQTCEVCVEFMGKIPPDKLADVLFEYGKSYNDALICPEQNTFGYFTCTKLRDMGYPRLYYQSNRGDAFDYRPTNAEEIPGFSTQTKTRAQILAKLEEAIRNGVLKTYSQRLFDQLQAFVWNGSKAQASKDAHDDLIISLAIGTWLVSGENSHSEQGMSMAYAMLKATAVGNRGLDSLPGGINDVRPISNHHIQGFTPQNVGKPRRPEDVKHASVTDFSWLYK